MSESMQIVRVICTKPLEMSVYAKFGRMTTPTINFVHDERVKGLYDLTLSFMVELSEYFLYFSIRTAFPQTYIVKVVKGAGIPVLSFDEHHIPQPVSGDDGTSRCIPFNYFL